MTNDQKAREWALSRVGCPYLYGGTGQFCTVAYRKARMKQYPDYTAKMARNCPRLSGSATTCKGCRWYDESAGTGKRAYDCAQLTRWCMDAIGIQLVSGANSQWTKTDWAERGEISDMPRDKTCLVYRESGGKMSHTGIYLGDGTVVHARGHDYGVVRQELGKEVSFTHYAVPNGLYEWHTIVAKNGDSGQAVGDVQERLLALGYALPKYGADGKYGAETEKAVRDAQRDAGFPVTGVVDKQTWGYLTELEGDAQSGADNAANRQNAECIASDEILTLLRSLYDALAEYYGHQ